MVEEVAQAPKNKLQSELKLGETRSRHRLKIQTMNSLALKVKGYIKAKKHAWQRHQNTHPTDRGASKINVLREFPVFRPSMVGPYQDKAGIVQQSVRNIFPFLSSLSQAAGHPAIQLIECEDFPKDEESKVAAQRLAELFNAYGSDKANDHNYYWLYGSILKNNPSVKAILEIGLGTNNEDVACNMGRDGRPGASLRAFRDFCQQAMVYGADIDEAILFEEERIQTFVVDQTSPAAFEALLKQLPAHFDLVIDDGLHAPDANILTLCYGLKLIKPGGWVVIEDILVESQPIWQSVSALLPVDRYDTYFINAHKGLMFAVQRKS